MPDTRNMETFMARYPRYEVSDEGMAELMRVKKTLDKYFRYNWFIAMFKTSEAIRAFEETDAIFGLELAKKEQEEAEGIKSFFVTFGQIHEHRIGEKVFDKDTVALIKSKSEGEARNHAFNAFGNKWAFIYDKLPDMIHFPKGVVRL